MKKSNLPKYILAYIGLAGLAVTVQANIVTVTPGSPGSWHYETASYGSSPGYTFTSGSLPIVSSPADPGTGGSAQLAFPATPGGGGSAQISTTAYDGQLLSSITSLSYDTYDVANNGQQFPYIRINVSTDGSGSAGSIDAVFFEPPYQSTATGGPGIPNQGAPVTVSNPHPSVMNQWQSWDAMIGGWWDNNGVLGTGGYNKVKTISDFETLYPNATIVSSSFWPGDVGGISIPVGWDGSGASEGYVNNVTINGTTYNFEPAAPVPEANTMIAGLLMLLPFGASAFRILRKKQSA